MAYKIILEDLDDDTTTIEDLQDLQVVREHTALSDWRATIPINLDLEEWRFAAVTIEEDDEQKFRGFLEVIETQQRQSTTTIQGRGMGKHLVDGEQVVSYELIEAHEAIQDYWDEHTPFTATVQEPDVEQVVEDRLILSLTSSERMEAEIELEATDPVKVEDDQVDLLQSCFVRDARYWDDQEALHEVIEPGERDDFSNGSGIVFKRAGGWVEYTFTPQYNIPAEYVNLATRQRYVSGGGSTPTMEYFINGEQVGSDGFSSAIPLSWRHWRDYSGQDLEAGEPVTVRIEADSTGRRLVEVDLVVLYDDRFNYTWGGTVNAQGALPGPELFPDAHTVSLGSIDAGLNINQARMETKWRDLSGDQALSLALQGANRQTASNTQTIEADFEDDNGLLVQPEITLSRYGARSDRTPRSGFKGQSVATIRLYVDGDNKRLISDRELSGTHLQNLQTLHNLANMRFTIDHTEATDLVVESYPAGEEETPDWTVIDRTRKIDVKGYANRVRVRGREREDGTRPLVIKENQGEIDRLNGTVISFPITDPQIDNLTDADARAEAEIRDRSTRDRLEGSITVAGGLPKPGKSYHIAGWDLTLPIEKVTYQEREGELEATIDFDEPDTLGLEISTVKRDGRRVEDAI